ncbi:phytoene desaturase family protein [Desulfopila inferna]|uniref:phytoene desaturase family protein n=1 Tax=Desulfopila inferna TaxID=468528 RepID=UPI0019628A4F|nr:NAD(P)/FAD-dependent oxidoreductase [Desulfopila inferna]MBM9604263.1 NAD(P)/FAD-dependent oxidoreductase [Desulfopila inferna]
MHSDIVIIGSGISALTAAALLAKKGAQVLVIEKERRIGGAVKQFKRKGIPFDVGFHYTGCLGEDEILHKLWRFCGILNHLEILPFPDHGSDRIYLTNRDRPIDSFFSYERIIRELQHSFPQEKLAISSYFDTLRAICRRIPFYNQDLSLTQFLQEFRSSRLSVKAFVQGLTKDSELQAVLTSPVALYGIPTDNASIDVHAMVAHGYRQGAYSVEGGGQAVVDAFEHVCKAGGVSFLPGVQVAEIDFDDRGVTGVKTDSSDRISCNRIIYTGHPTSLIPLMGTRAFRPVYRKRLLQLKNTISMNVLFGVMPKPPPSLEWHNHIFLPGGSNPLDKKNNQIKDRLLMVTSTARGSFSLRQDYKSVILLQPAWWEEVKMFENSTSCTRPTLYHVHKEEISRAMIAQAEKCISSDFKRIEPLAVGTPLTFRDELSAPQGCAYGASHSLDQYTPDIRTRVPGLYLSGQSTLMTGIVGASLAGFTSAGYILGLEPFWEELRSCS